jgi:formate-dependent nitrite reductase membrane component NrfD
MAGSSAVMAALADATGRPGLRRAGRLAAGLGSAASMAALIHDLGRPERFLNMLRVAKPTSPLSVGSWILAPFGTLSAAAAASEVSGVAPWAGRVAGAGAAVLGPAMAVYTAVLFANTAVPAWNEAYRELPFVFAGGAMASGGAMALITTPIAETGPARRMTLVGSVVELAAASAVERRHGLVSEPYRTGRAGVLLRASRALTGAGVLGAVLGRRNRAVSATAGALVSAGAICARFGIFEAGKASAADPKYTVVPQRARMTG